MVAEADGARRISRDGLSLELAPLPHEQSRAFLVARGFPEADARWAAERGCFFRSAIANSASAANAPSIDIALGAWRVTAVGAATGKPLLTREGWDGEWRARAAGEAAAVAFHWALFPTAQTFAPTDHNWGFLTFDLPAGTRFALDIVWRVGGREATARIDDLECAR